uniref:C-type lectin domain-containing protein n=1 Tax=Oryzias melastigma TaxID=30732 RepID=A0A3B3DYQ0_ORYME
TEAGGKCSESIVRGLWQTFLNGISVFLSDFFWFTMCQLHKYHYIDQQLDWTQAQQFCRKSYTDLATVRSMADIDQLKNAFKNRNGAWIGLHNSNTWRWSLPDLQFKEEDTKWGGGEPKDGKNCGAIWKTHAKWEAISCEKSTDFICYNGNQETWSGFAVSEVSFRNEFFINICVYSTDRDSSKRLYFIQQKKNWFEAQEYCEKEHTGLVGGAQLKELEEACFWSILNTDSSQELCQDERLSELFMPDNEAPVVAVDSLDQVCTSHDIFIGLIRDTWAWSDGSSFSSRSWHPVFPKTAGNKNCIMMNNKGEWINHDCKNKGPFICYTGND